MEELLNDIDNEVEYLTSYEGEEYECITIENLQGILNRYKISKL